MKTCHYVGASMRLSAISALEYATKHALDSFEKAHASVKELKHISATTVGLDSDDEALIDSLNESVSISHENLTSSARELAVLSDSAHDLKVSVLRDELNDSDIEEELRALDTQALKHKQVIHESQLAGERLRRDALDSEDTLSYDTKTETAKRTNNVLDVLSLETSDIVASTRFATSCFDWFENDISKSGFDEEGESVNES